MELFIDNKVDFYWGLVCPISHLGPTNETDIEVIKKDSEKRRKLKNIAIYLENNKDNVEFRDVLSMNKIDYDKFVTEIDDMRICNKEIPSVIIIYIKFNDKNINYYDTVNNMLNLYDEVSNDDSGKYDFNCSKSWLRIQTDGIKIAYIRKDVKKEFVDKVNEINNSNDVLKKEYDDMINKLDSYVKSIGLNKDDIEYKRSLNLLLIPNEYFEYEERKSAFITVMCNKKTKFYNALLDAGVLEKTYPKWYKYGEY